MRCVSSEVCGYSSTRKDNFERHKWTSSEEKWYRSCDITLPWVDAKTLFSFFAEKFRRPGLWPPVVGKFCKRWSNLDFNHLTLRIEPFGEFRKKKSFLPWACPAATWACPIPKCLNIWRTAAPILLIFSVVIVLNGIYLNIQHQRYWGNLSPENGQNMAKTRFHE